MLDMFGSTAVSLVSKSLGRSLRGRWDRIDSFESLLVRTWKYVPEVFDCAREGSIE